MGAWVDVISSVTTTLQYVAPMLIGERMLPSNTIPPRYVVVPVRERYTQPEAIGGNPQLLYNALVELEFHSWGADYASASVMNQALLTALRSTMKGGPNIVLGEAIWTDPKWAQNGAVLTLTCSLRLGVPRAVIPTTAGSAAGDDTATTVTITGGALDATGASNTDGVLDAGEG